LADSSSLTDKAQLLAQVAEIMQCPNCGQSLHVATGELRCDRGHIVPTRSGYLDVSSTDSDVVTRRTFESFGYEWTTFDDVRDEDREFWSTYSEDLNPRDLAGRNALDAGCGKGRFSRFLAPQVRTLVALDGSEAVTVATRNLAHEMNALVVRGDLRTVPFRSDSFGFISCLGVLHHLDDPENAFCHLVSLLENDGLMLLYVYSKPKKLISSRGLGLASAGILRILTTRMPHRALNAFSAFLSLVLYLSIVVPGNFGDRVGIGIMSHLPLATYRGKPLRSLRLDTFDRLSAPIEHRYTWSELQAWFDHACMRVESAREEAGWFVVGRKVARE
jgi:SAM-dependent methyltransferase